MPRRFKLLAGVILLLAVIALTLYPRLRRTFKYAEFVSQPNAAQRLAITPNRVDLSQADDLVSVATLWAEFKVPGGLITSMSPHETWLIIDSESDTSVVLTELHYETQFSSDGNYSFYLDAANVSPRSSIDVFGMSDSEFESHIKLITEKYAEGLRDRGVSVFETEAVKGFILHGGAQEPTDVLVQLWDKNHSVCQYIIVISKDPGLRKEIAKTIASTFRFTVESVPDRGALIDLVAKSAAMFHEPAG